MVNQTSCCILQHFQCMHVVHIWGTGSRPRPFSVSPVFGMDGRSILAFVLMNIHLSLPPSREIRTHESEKREKGPTD